MSRLLEIRHSTQGACRFATRALVVGFFADERPLRGEAGLVDWRMNGYVSRLLERQRLSGETEESTLVASSGRLRAEFSLLMGLGERSLYGYERITNVTAGVTQTLQKLHVDEFALENHPLEPSPGIDCNVGRSGGHERLGVSVAKRAYEIAVPSC